MNRTGESIKYKLDHAYYQIWSMNIMEPVGGHNYKMYGQGYYLRHAIYKFGIMWNLDNTVISTLI